jgi:dienelactone hydrolase
VPVAAGCPATGPRDGSDELFVAGGDLDAARDLVKTVEGAELFLYPGDQHLFTDNSLPAYEESAATLLMQRVLSFLGSVA